MSFVETVIQYIALFNAKGKKVKHYSNWVHIFGTKNGYIESTFHDVHSSQKLRDLDAKFQKQLYGK